MNTLLLALALAAGAVPALPPAARTTPPPAVQYCPVTVTRDYVVGPSYPADVQLYQANVQLDPTCPPDGQARVRKRGSLGRHVIEPKVGAWTVRPGETLRIWVFTHHIEYFAGRGEGGREIWLEAPVR